MLGHEWKIPDFNEISDLNKNHSCPSSQMRKALSSGMIYVLDHKDVLIFSYLEELQYPIVETVRANDREHGLYLENA